MKIKKEELDIDFIGAQEPLTVKEEKALSEYFKKKKKVIPAKTRKVQQQKVH